MLVKVAASQENAACPCMGPKYIHTHLLLLLQEEVAGRQLTLSIANVYSLLKHWNRVRKWISTGQSVRIHTHLHEVGHLVFWCRNGHLGCHGILHDPAGHIEVHTLPLKFIHRLQSDPDKRLLSVSFAAEVRSLGYFARRRGPMLGTEGRLMAVPPERFVFVYLQPAPSRLCSTPMPSQFHIPNC